VIYANNLPRALRQESPPRVHKVGDVDGRRLRFCGRFAMGYSGRAVFTTTTKESFGPVRFELFFRGFFVAAEILLLLSRLRS
jgi:hypothetical protein